MNKEEANTESAYGIKIHDTPDKEAVKPFFFVAAEEEIKKHAMEAYPNECCGILMGNRIDGKIKISTAVKTVNTAREGDTGACFSIDPLTLYGYEKKYKEKNIDIVGFYHSHPDKPAVVSDRDKEYMIPGMVYALVSSKRSGCSKIRLWMKEV